MPPKEYHSRRMQMFLTGISVSTYPTTDTHTREVISAFKLMKNRKTSEH